MNKLILFTLVLLFNNIYSFTKSIRKLLSNNNDCNQWQNMIDNKDIVAFKQCISDKPSMMNKAFMSEIVQNNIETVKIFIIAGINVNCYAFETSVGLDSTPLFTAIYYQRTDIVDLLLETTDVDVNFKRRTSKTVLQYAIHVGNVDILDKLLKKNIDVNVPIGNLPPLMYAIYEGKLDIIDTLLKFDGIDVNLRDDKGETALMHAVWRCGAADAHENYDFMSMSEIFETILETDGVDVNIQDNEGKTALIHAIKPGLGDIIDKLLKKDSVNVDIKDNSGKTALDYALKYNSRGIHIMPRLYERLEEKSLIDLLNKDGIDVNDRDKFEGKTVLMYALEKRYNELVDELLERNDIKVNIKDKENGKTTLMYAIDRDELDIIDTLLEKEGINVNIRDNYKGTTALMQAIRMGRKGIIDKLLEKDDINIYITDDFGKTAIDYASQYGYADMNFVDFVDKLSPKNNKVSRKNNAENPINEVSSNESSDKKNELSTNAVISINEVAPNKSCDKKNELSTGAVIGIAIGSFIFGVLIGVISTYIIIKKK